MNIASLFASLLFGAVGFVAFAYGKRQQRVKILLIGMALMAYPYFVPNVLAMYVIGTLLTAAIFIVRD